MCSWPRARAWPVLMAVAVALVLPAGATPAAAVSPEQDAVRERREAVVEEQRQASTRLDETTRELAELATALDQANAAVGANRTALEAAQSELSDARAREVEIAGRLAVAVEQEKIIGDELARAREEHAAAVADVGRSARDAYLGAQRSIAVEVVLGSTSMEELANRSSLLDRLGRLQGDVAARAQLKGVLAQSALARRTAARELVEDLRRQAEENVDRAHAAEAAQDRLTREAEALASQQEALIAEAAARRDAEVVRIDALEQEANALQAEMERLAREAAERAAREQAAREQAAREQAERDRAARERAAAEHAAADRARRQSSSGSVHQHADNAPAAPDPVAEAPSPTGLLRPVSGRVTSSYGWRIHPVYGTRRLHRGTDFGNGCGTPVRAAAGGTVASAAAAGSAGNRIIIDHGVMSGRSTGTVYMHLQGFAVRAGERVSRGDVIGYVGTTGASTGCHLHFELYEGGRPVDPMSRL